MTARLSKPTAAIILFKSKSLADGSHPVVLRVNYLGRRKYYTIDAASPDQWNDSANRYKKNKEGNIRLNAFEAKAVKILAEFEETEREFSFDRFEKAFFVNANLKKVLVFIKQEIERLKAADRAGTLSVMKTVYNSLYAFRSGRDFTFLDIDKSFLERYEAHLAKTCTTNGIAVYMRQLKAAYNDAIALGLVKKEHYPFDEYKIKTAPTRKRALTKSQIDALIKCKVERGSRKYHSLNYFLLSYFTRGMNFVDIARLTESDIVNERIFYVRSKTKTSRTKGDGRIFSVPVRGWVREILNEYRGQNFPYIFPILKKKYQTSIAEKWALKKKAKQVNEDLQTICADLKFQNPDEITFYAARHSWATLTRKAGARTELIQQGLGHGNVKTTEVYLADFETEELDEADKFLDGYTNMKAG